MVKTARSESDEKTGIVPTARLPFSFSSNTSRMSKVGIVGFEPTQIFHLFYRQARLSNSGAFPFFETKGPFDCISLQDIRPLVPRGRIEINDLIFSLAGSLEPISILIVSQSLNSGTKWNRTTLSWASTKRSNRLSYSSM